MSENNSTTLEQRKAKRQAASKAYYEANREAVLARMKAQHEANKEADAAYQRAWYQANKRRQNAASKAYREANKEDESERQKAWYKANKERAVASRKAYYEANKEAVDAWKESYTLKRKYGITAKDRDAMIKTQRNRCAGCKMAFGILKEDKPHVDHCYATGVVRGILCANCNRAIGLMQDNPKIARALARYLEQAKSSPESIS